MTLQRFVTNWRGHTELRNSPAVIADITRRARAMASTDPEIELGEVRTSGGIRGRASITVYTLPRNRDALVRALDAGRR